MTLLYTVNGGQWDSWFCLNIYYVIFFFKFRNPLAQMEDEKRDHDAKLKKMEINMEEVFEKKVKEKKQKLKDSEIAVSILFY